MELFCQLKRLKIFKHGHCKAILMPMKKRPQLDAGVSPIRLQKYLARGLFAIVIVALACAFTWASAWMWP